MYPLVYHLGVDDYFPNEEFEPHLFQHVAAWRRANRRPSAVRRLVSALMQAIRRTHGSVRKPSTTGPAPSVPGKPAIRWS